MTLTAGASKNRMEEAAAAQAEIAVVTTTPEEAVEAAMTTIEGEAIMRITAGEEVTVEAKMT